MTLRGSILRRDAQAHLPLGFLIPHDRPVQLPLSVWVKTIEQSLDSIEAASEQTFEFCGTVSEYFNQTALIECYFGRIQVAEDLCAAQLRWIRNASRRMGRPEILGFALQPWINLARIDRLLKRTEEALQKLSLLIEARHAKLGMRCRSCPGNVRSTQNIGQPSGRRNQIWTGF